MFNVANWFKNVLNLYKKKLFNENLFEKYKIDDFESFLKRKNESMKFSQLLNTQSLFVYMLFDHELKDLFTSYTTSRKSSLKQLSNIIDEDIIDEDIIDKNTVTNKDVIDEDIIDKDIVTSKNVIDEDIIDKDIITSKDVIDENIIDKDIATNKDVIDEDIIDKNIVTKKDVIDEDIIDKNIVMSKDVIDENIIEKNVITSKNVIEKIIIKEIDTQRSKRDQMNDYDFREFNEFEKKICKYTIKTWMKI